MVRMQNGFESFKIKLTAFVIYENFATEIESIENKKNPVLQNTLSIIRNLKIFFVDEISYQFNVRRQKKILPTSGSHINFALTGEMVSCKAGNV